METIEEAKARIAELEQAKQQAEQDKQNAVAELIEKRGKLQATEEELTRLKTEKDKQTPPTDNPEEVVNRILEQKSKETAKQSFEEAKEEIKKLYKEFDPATDAAGIVFSSFEKELSKFNFDGLKTKEEFVARLKEVYDFQNRKKSNTDKQNFYQGAPQNQNEVVVADTSLTATEHRLLTETGWTKEKYLEVKSKRPHYVAQLLKLRAQ